MDDDAIDAAFRRAWDETDVAALEPRGWTGAIWRWRWAWRAIGFVFIAYALWRASTDGLIAVGWALFGVVINLYPLDLRRAYNDGAYQSCRTMVKMMFQRRRDDPA